MADKQDITMVEDSHVTGDNRSDTEKGSAVRMIDNIRVLGLSEEDADFYNNFDEARRKKLVWKVDIRLVPMLAVLYLISQLDRANIGNAKIEGLDVDLNLTGVQYNIALSLFFVPYVLLEVPSNVLLKKFARPSTYLGILVTTWGVLMTCHGFVHNFAQLTALRVMLGVFEAGFYPGAVYLTSFWYMPKALATRIAVFYCASSLSGAFSGLLAAGIAEMDGVGGYEGWAWIFILEGIVTVVLGVMCFFCLIDSPDLSGRWLEEDEIRYLNLQLFIKQGGRFSDEGKDKFNWGELKAIVTEPNMWGHAFILFACSACSYGNKFTLPSITKAMGFSSTNAQLLTVPPYIAGAVASICVAKLSDHFKWRMPFVVLPLLCIVVGYSIIISFKGDLPGNVGASMFAACLSCIGIYPIQPACSSWASNNLAPSSKRSVGIAFVICIGNIGGILGSYMYLDAEAPAYPTGFGISIALGISGILVTLAMEWRYNHLNKTKGKMTEHEIRSLYSEDDLLQMGDKSPLFKHTI